MNIHPNLNFPNGQHIAIWQGQQINKLLADTAQFTLVHSLLLAAGIVLSS